MSRDDWEADCWPIVSRISWCGKFERKEETDE
jgi:hypothetical protein